MIAGVTLPRRMLIARPADALATSVAVLAVDAYRRFLSPRKGYSCPHRLLHGRRSCSAHGRLILRRVGVFHFRVLMRRRFERCRAARLQLVAMAEFDPNRSEANQRRRGHAYCGHYYFDIPFCAADGLASNNGSCVPSNCDGFDLPGDCGGCDCSP